jgi:Right handed beta helix region
MQLPESFSEITGAPCATPPPLANRVKDKPEALEIADDDWTMLDGETNGVRKFDPRKFLPVPGEGRLQANTIADLQSLSTVELPDEVLVDVLGYYAPGDGGGGQFRFDDTSVLASNGGTVIAPTVGAGRWLRIVDGAINAKWFGLKADDPTARSINKTAWRALFSTFAASRAQTEIHIPDGVYNLDPTFSGGVINIPSGTTIRMGKKTKIVVDIPTPTPGDDLTHKWIVFRIIGTPEAPISDILIEGGEIVGNKTTDLVWAYGYAYGVNVNANCSRITVRDMVIRDCWSDCLGVSGGSDLRFENVECYGGLRHCGSITGGGRISFVGCRFSDPDWYMAFDMEIESPADVENVTFDRCVFSGSGYTGLAIVSGSSGKKAVRTKVLNSEFFGHYPRGAPTPPAERPPAGLGIALNTQAAVDATIENCVFHDNTGDNLSFGSSTGGMITRCIIRGGNKGIALNNSQKVSVLNCDIRDTADDAITGIASLPAYPLANNKIGFNTITNSGGRGIDVRGCDNQVFNNRIDKIQTQGIFVNGAQNTMVSGNKVSECGMSATNIDAVTISGTGNMVFGNDIKKCALSQTAAAQVVAPPDSSKIKLSASASPSAGDYVGFKITILSGTGAGQTKTITAYSSLVATVDTPWATPPDATSIYEIIPAGNCQRYGLINTSERSTIFDNDTNLGGATAGFLEGGTATIAIPVGTVGTTLALTGALSAPTLTLTGTGAVINRTGASTAFSYFGISTTGQFLQLGVDRNTGGGLATGSGGYSVVLNANSAGTNLHLATQGVVRFTLDTNGNIVHVVKAPPASATAAGVTGQIAWDDNYLYQCIATNVWKRSPLTTW